MPPTRNPSCGSSSASRGPGRIVVLEIILAAELQQWKAVLRKWNRLLFQLRGHSGVIEHRVPNEVGHEYLQQRCALGGRSLPVSKKVHRTGEWLFSEWQEHWTTFLLN